MPVQLDTKLPGENAEARIEIIPLIDIMFFLLAAFMLISLSMVNLKSMKVNLPSAATASADTAHNLADITVDKTGSIFLDKTPTGPNELLRALVARRNANAGLRVLISGDRDTPLGDVIRVLDLVNTAGISNAAFDIKPAAPASQP